VKNDPWVVQLSCCLEKDKMGCGIKILMSRGGGGCKNEFSGTGGGMFYEDLKEVEPPTTS